MPSLLKLHRRERRARGVLKRFFFLCVLRVLCGKNSTASACGPLMRAGRSLRFHIGFATLSLRLWPSCEAQPKQLIQECERRIGTRWRATLTTGAAGDRI